VDEIPKLQEGRPNLVDLMKNGQVRLVVNTPSGKVRGTDEGQESAPPPSCTASTCITTLPAALAAVRGLPGAAPGRADRQALQDWFAAG